MSLDHLSLVFDVVHFFLPCMCCCLFAFVSVFSQLQSRRHSWEVDNQLGEVQEEDEAGDRGRESCKEERMQGGSKESGRKIERDMEQQEDLMDKEEELHQRSASETNLR